MNRKNQRKVIKIPDSWSRRLCDGKENDFSRSFYPFEQFPGLDKAVEQEGRSGGNEQYREISGSNEEKSWKLAARNLISLSWTNPSNLLQKYAGPPAGAGRQETIMRCKPSPTMRCSANITFLINLEKSIVGTWHHKTLVWLARSRRRVEISQRKTSIQNNWILQSLQTVNPLHYRNMLISISAPKYK